MKVGWYCAILNNNYDDVIPCIAVIQLRCGRSVGGPCYIILFAETYVSAVGNGSDNF